MGIPLAALAVNQNQPSPIDTVGRALQLKSLQQNQQYQAQAQPLALEAQRTGLAEQQDVIASRQALRQAYANAVKPDEKGQPQIDTDALTSALSQSGHGDQIPGILESVNKFQKTKNDLIESAQKIQAGAADLSGHAAAAIKNANYDPNVAHTILDTLPQNAQTDQMRKFVDGDPAIFKQHVDAAYNASPAIQKELNEQTVAKIRAGGAGANPLGDKVPAFNQMLERRYQVLNPGKPLPNDMKLQPEATQKDLDNVDKMLQQTEQAQSTKAQQDVSNGLRQQMFELAKQTRMNQLTTSAIDLPAQNYLETGQMPAGMRSPAMASAIINRAAELAKQNPELGNLAANRAAYEANKKSYDNVTGTLDTLTAFENAGKKNLDGFMKLANKLPDTGIPWINTPVRKLDKNLVGAEYLPAVEAAKSVGLREIARVTNDPKLKGTLTDSARQEVEGLVPDNATLPQIKHVVDVLLQDVKNVHESVAAQKADIGGRLGIKSSSTQAGGAGGAKLTRAQIEQAAQDHNVSVAEVERQAKAKGIQFEEAKP